MDFGDAVPLSTSFPLPFRVLFLIGLGILGWATNLHGLHLLGIDAGSALDLHSGRIFLPTTSSSPRPSSSPRVAYMPIYRLFAGYTAWCFAGWSFFRLATHSNAMLVDAFKFIPALSSLGVLTTLICPFELCQKRERDLFLQSAARCLFSSMDSPVYFSDVVFADVFTSFAKVFGDVWLSLCMLLPHGSLLSPPPLDGLSQWVLPALMSLPYIVRFRQCLIELRSPTNTSKRPLFNALKYASSFPVIFLSAAQRIVVLDLAEEKGELIAREPWHGEHPLFRLWLLAAAVNSLYSFWWDLTNDWGLDLLKPRSAESRSNPPRPLVLPSLHLKASSIAGSSETHGVTQSHPSSGHQVHGGAIYRHQSYPYGLRPVLLYPLLVYPLVIFFNLVLRMTWSIKLSSHLYSQSEGSALMLWLEVAEILRRWMWVFVRVEWEVVKNAQHKSQIASNGTVPEEVELMPSNRSDPMGND
ncbi:EXS family-domain-containing protein [Suillus clintonianus]|uniref:EXS family-domain-containing protein n=1 Tax=Suillus clintonianus TaxID=1904413 RepID=UPI001B862411|nr:EXS family-domain-containing protein [Suillus clintonianus]KAG2150900.1 EXS family-domain-containing protein [Suillus clintonianus]